MPEHDEDWTAPTVPGRHRGALHRVLDGALRAVTAWRAGGDLLSRVRSAWKGGEETGSTVRPRGPGRARVAAQPSSGLRGSQAELAAAAEAAVLEVQAVLDELEPLRPTDDEDLEVRAQVLMLVKELAAELAHLTTPHGSRVDRLLATLVGPPRGDGPAHVEGELGRLRDRLGIRDGGVPSSTPPAEEERVARYLRLVDAVLTLRRRWELHRAGSSGSSTAQQPP